MSYPTEEKISENYIAKENTTQNSNNTQVVRTIEIVRDNVNPRHNREILNEEIDSDGRINGEEI